MLENNVIIKVTNRDNGSVGYSVPDLGIRREFMSGESKNVTMEELRKLSYIPGGLYILQNYLTLDNKDAVAELLNEVEPEYYYTKEDLVTLLKTGSIEQFEDCLDYAPAGTIDMIKVLAVELPLTDTTKIDALFKATGFNAATAIRINKEAAENTENIEDKPKRRASAINEEKAETTTSTRRAQPVTSKYKIVK